jgi:hypothetical protein
VVDGVTDNTAPPELLKDLGAEIKKKAIQGTLAVHIVHCKDLVAEHPESVKNYVEISADNGKKFEETKVVPSTNPLFKQTLLFQLNLESIEFLKPVLELFYLS